MARLFLYLLLFFSITVRAEASITSIRVGNQPNGVTRIVLDATKDIDFNIFTLLKPHRLVVDVKSASLKLDKNKAIPVTGVVSKVRWGQFDGKSRVAIELKEAVEVKKQFSLPPASGFKWRLVIDITPKKTNKNKVWGNDDAVNMKSKNSIVRKDKPIIIVDPGHGGKDPGAIGITGLMEKKVTLMTGLALKNALEKTGKYKVIMTRYTDKAIALHERVQFARKNNGSLFVSIHADSAPNRKARGLSVYSISEKASDKEAKMLAERENKADIIAGFDFSNQAPEVADILLDLVKRETDNFSSLLAEYVVDDMSKTIRVIKNPHRFAGFAVLKAPDIPSILVEIGYLSNREDEKLIKQAAYRNKVVASIVRSINKYFQLRAKNDNL